MAPDDKPALAARLDTAIDKAIDEKRIVGTTTLVAKDGKIVYARAAGMADRENGMPVQRDTIFRYASLTKPIVATLILKLHEDGKLNIDDPVSDHLPYFTPRLPDGTQPKISLRQLLCHIGGLPVDISPSEQELAQIVFQQVEGSYRHLSLEDNMKRLAALPLIAPPGTLWAYGLSLDVLGAVAAAVDGSTLNDAVARHITGPLGMTDSTFCVKDIDRLAVPYADAVNGAVRMQKTHTLQHARGHLVTFTPKRIMDPDVFPSGGGGMAGTADDFMRFLLALQRGELIGNALLDEATRNQLGDADRNGLTPGHGFGLIGAVVDTPELSGTPQNAGSYYWSGVFGNHWFVDPKAGVTLVSLTNTAFEGNNGPFTVEMRDAIYGV